MEVKWILVEQKDGGEDINIKYYYRVKWRFRWNWSGVEWSGVEWN